MKTTYYGHTHGPAGTIVVVAYNAGGRYSISVWYMASSDWMRALQPAAMMPPGGTQDNQMENYN